MHESNKKDEPITKGDMTKLINAFSRVAKELSEESKEPDTKNEQEPVTQTLNG
jgi:hypothetical protein